MRIAREETLFGLRPDTYILKFSKAELATIRKASAIMGEAREKCLAFFGPDFQDSDADEILAHGEYGFVDWIEEEELEVWQD